jgi:UTP--glucose-1-phosphate uridylyltransferase
MSGSTGTRVTKAVIPAAGLGTRFLPATKSLPKEMLPIVDTPTIQYVVEEAAAAGLTDVLVVTGEGKEAIAHYFSRDAELERHLEEKGKDELLSVLRSIDELPAVSFVRQDEPRGLGHAVLMAREHVGDEAFVVILGDDVMVDDARLLRRMLETQAEHGGAVLALQEVEPEQISAYGCATVEPVPGAPDVMRVLGVVEKPKPEDAPSNLAVIGRYVLPAAIFHAIEATDPGVGGEIQLTDAIGALIPTGEGDGPGVHGVVFSEGRFDAGDKLDFLRANLEIALDRPDLGPGLAAIVGEVARRRGLA